MKTGKHHCNQRFAKTATAAAFAAFVAILTLSTICLAESLRTQSPDKDAMGYPTNSAAAREMGMTEARRDLSNGVIMVKTAGLPPPDRQDYEQLLKARCNATLRPIAGCIVTTGLLAYVSGYNEISTTAIKQKLGTNIFDRLEQEAKARFQERLKNAVASEVSATRIYSVKPGDTLTKIARHHGVGVNDLVQANPGVKPTRLQVNQKLFIPGKEQP